eukprot:UN33396
MNCSVVEMLPCGFLGCAIEIDFESSFEYVNLQLLPHIHDTWNHLVFQTVQIFSQIFDLFLNLQRLSLTTRPERVFQFCQFGSRMCFQTFDLLLQLCDLLFIFTHLFSTYTLYSRFKALFLFFHLVILCLRLYERF